MVSSLRPNDKYKHIDDSCHDNGQAAKTRRHRYSQSKVDRLKFTLVVVNTLLFALGAISLGFSVFGLIQFKLLGYEETFQSVTIVTIVPWMAVVSSTLTVTMVPLYGCYGAVTQRKNLLILFLLYLLLLLLLDLVMCIWVVTTADKIQKAIEQAVKEAVHEYRQNTDKQRSMDDLQTNLGCCGYDHGVSDFGSSGPPASCKHNYIMTPCNTKMQTVYKEYRYIAMGVFAALAAILMFAIILVLSLLTAMRRKKPPRPEPPGRPRPDIAVIEPPPLVPPPPPLPAPPNRPSTRNSPRTGVIRLGTTNESSCV